MNRELHASLTYPRVLYERRPVELRVQIRNDMRELGLRAYCDETKTTSSLATIEIHSTLQADVRTTVGPSVRKDAPAARPMQDANHQIMMHHARDGQDSE